MEELTKCPDGKMRECGYAAKVPIAVAVTCSECSVCIPLQKKIKELEKETKSTGDSVEDVLKSHVKEEFKDKALFKRELTHLINKFGLDSFCNTSDYVISEFLYSSFHAFAFARACQYLRENPDKKMLQRLTCGHENFLRFVDISHICTICGNGTVELGSRDTATSKYQNGEITFEEYTVLLDKGL